MGLFTRAAMTLNHSAGQADDQRDLPQRIDLHASSHNRLGDEYIKLPPDKLTSNQKYNGNARDRQHSHRLLSFIALNVELNLGTRSEIGIS